MKKAVLFLVILSVLAVVNISCVSSPYIPDKEPAGSSHSYSLTSGIAITMHFVPHLRFYGRDLYDLKIKYLSVESAFWMAETETTYEQWKVIYDWAISHGYTFENTGTMGDGSSTADKQHPVTMVNHRDAFVWCNALTEYLNNSTNAGLACVYYTDPKFDQPLRSSKSDGFEKKGNMEKGSFDNPFIRPEAKGFRLPGLDEWSLAAQYISDVDANGWLSEPGEFTPHSLASGVLSKMAGGDVDKVAWYVGNSGGHTHAVRSKAPNALGIYDMSGNVGEWCFMRHGPFDLKVSDIARGGSWISLVGMKGLGEDLVKIEHITFAEPFGKTASIGFRISRSE